MTSEADVPAEVRGMLAGDPVVGTWEPMFPLLTVDEERFSHVCLLSRVELHAGHAKICAVLSSPHTISNVGRDGRATLVVVGAHTAFYLKLFVEDAITDGRWLGIAFGVSTIKHDNMQIPLQPPRYLVTDVLSVTEDWVRSRRILARLQSRSRLPVDTWRPARAASQRSGEAEK